MTVNEDTACDLCGQAMKHHSIPANPLDKLPKFSGYQGQAMFEGVPFRGVRCPTAQVPAQVAELFEIARRLGEIRVELEQQYHPDSPPQRVQFAQGRIADARVGLYMATRFLRGEEDG